MCVVVAPLLVHCFPKGGASKVCCKEGGQEGKEQKRQREAGGEAGCVGQGAKEGEA